MALLYADHGARLVCEVVHSKQAKADAGTQWAGGFMLSDAESETLFAVLPDGAVVSRTAARPNVWFDAPDAEWTPVASVPGHAEWIGVYPIRLALADARARA